DDRGKANQQKGGGMMNDGAIRNFEQLQEDEGGRKTPKLVTVAFVILGGACIAFAAVALGGRHAKTEAPKQDPPGGPGAQRGHTAGKASDLNTKDVTFPNILSDGDKPTTALAAVRNSGAGAGASPDAPTEPPPATDKLPIVPLPAQNILEAT